MEYFMCILLYMTMNVIIIYYVIDSRLFDTKY